MKRILTLVAALLGLFLVGPSARAQKITAASYIDSCFMAGGSYFQAYVSVNSPTSLSGCRIETNYGDGSKLDTVVINGTIPNFYAYPSVHSYTLAGTYTVSHVLYCGSTRIDTLSKSVNISCKYMGGYLYNDANSNCVYNTTESLVYGTGKIEVDSAGTKVDTITTWGGFWWYRPLAASTTVYKFKMLSSPASFTNTCPSSGVITYSYTPSLTAVTGLDFGFSCSASPTFDYSLYYSRALRGSASPGASYIRLTAQNTSCHTGTSTVTLNVSPKYNITSSGITPAPASVSGNTVTWTITGLSYGTYSMYVPLTPKSTTNNGDTACNNAVITPLTGDSNPTNNSVAICDSVRASWDPNEKSVQPSEALAGSLLTYTIDFENLGNDTAFNIHVQDTLSANLDVNTLAIIASTHPVQPYIYQNAGSNIIKFDFPRINLEDKNHPNGNKGQIQFTMKLKSGLAPGTTTTNRAGIYFDGNPVVLTNYAFTHIPVPNGVQTLSGAQNVSVFPNPADEVVNVRIKGNGWTEAVLSNAVGQVVLLQSLGNGNNMLNVAQLPAGIYLLNVRGSEGSTSMKIEKR
jgi:uncharacterized repeat protein (TIGR01451 family)